MNFNFKNIQNELLAPGDIFWQKNSGAILLSKKGDMINFELIKKLEDAGHTLAVENGIDQTVHHEFMALYEKYCEELLMKDKIKWREQLIELFRVEYIQKNKEQFDLNLLCWKLFTKFSRPEGVSFIERDSELFKRHLSVASSYTVSAFLLGYYEPEFLSNLFSSTLKNLMELGKSESVMGLKEKLDYLYMLESFNSEDYEVIKNIAAPEVISGTVVFEKYDGSGLRQINSREMSDLEIMLVALSSAYGFKQNQGNNILYAIEFGEFKCEAKVLRMLQRVLLKKEPQSLLSVG